jgi:hypothetical protein
MPAKSERVKVEVKESTTPDLRTFNITLTAPTRDFQLTDLLKQRGVIESLDAELKQAIKRATESYLKSAEVLISGLASKSSEPDKSRSNSNDNNKSAQSISGAEREL